MSDLLRNILEIFSSKGSLSRIQNFDYRPQQLEMAQAISQALESNKHLVIEAPTGVGKSLAYLFPQSFMQLKIRKKP